MTGQLRDRVETRTSERGTTGFAQFTRRHPQNGPIAEPAMGQWPSAAAKQLAGVVHGEIIPRLAFALDPSKVAGDKAEPAALKSCSDDVRAFTKIILTGEIAEACAVVEEMCSQGRSLEQIYLELLEPTALHLGDLWSADARDFVAITVAVLRLQEILHEFGPAFRRESDAREHGHHALLVPAPGEKDTFGHLIFGTFRLVIAAEFLRRDGWDAYVDASATSDSIASLLRDEWFDLVEISLSSENHIDRLTAGIRRFRKASRNQSVGIIVTGPLFGEHPELASRVGADIAASDTPGAARQAARLMDQLRPR